MYVSIRMYESNIQGYINIFIWFAITSAKKIDYQIYRNKNGHVN